MVTHIKLKLLYNYSIYCFIFISKIRGTRPYFLRHHQQILIYLLFHH